MEAYHSRQAHQRGKNCLENKTREIIEGHETTVS